MNQPIEQRFRKLEERVEDIEHTFKEVIKNEEQLIRLSQRHRHNTEHLKVIVEGIALDIGDTRERFDTIERTQAEHGQLLQSHEELLKGHIADVRERFDTIERTQAEHGQLLQSHSGRFDTIEHTQTEHGQLLQSQGELLRQILARLEPR